MERLRSASAIFLALYDEPAAGAQDITPPGTGAGGDGGGGDGRSCCRLGDLLRQVGCCRSSAWYVEVVVVSS